MWLPCGFLRTGSHQEKRLLFWRAWWTGKDSNLRSPQGAADLQSAGFSHSPTRPKTSGRKLVSQNRFASALTRGFNRNTKRTRVQRHQPVQFCNPELLPPSLPADFWWSWRRELNPRPSDYKSDALPAELRQRRSNRVRIADSEMELQGAMARTTATARPVLWKFSTPLLAVAPSKLRIFILLEQINLELALETERTVKIFR